MKRIIIVEDDPAILDTMIIILRNAGYSVTTYFDGTLILNNDFTPPDIFIIDRLLPGVDGLEICRFLKTQEATGDIPVIMVSAMPEITRLAKEAGADGALEKPYSMRDIRELVAKHLESK